MQVQWIVSFSLIKEPQFGAVGCAFKTEHNQVLKIEYFNITIFFFLNFLHTFSDKMALFYYLFQKCLYQLDKIGRLLLNLIPGRLKKNWDKNDVENITNKKVKKNIIFFQFSKNIKNQVENIIFWHFCILQQKSAVVCSTARRGEEY